MAIKTTVDLSAMAWNGLQINKGSGLWISSVEGDSIEHCISGEYRVSYEYTGTSKNLFLLL